jgi:hypothetical protein
LREISFYCDLVTEWKSPQILSTLTQRKDLKLVFVLLDIVQSNFVIIQREFIFPFAISETRESVSRSHLM